MIPPAERQKMLAVPLCGPRVISRLEAIGIRSLLDLVDRDPDELVFAVNLSAGRPIWRPPMAHRAMDNLVTAARAAAACVSRRVTTGAGAARALELIEQRTTQLRLATPTARSGWQ